MSYRGSYVGIEQYNKRFNKRKRKKEKKKGKFIKILILLIVLCIGLGGINKLFSDKKIVLSSDKICYYIKTCDEISKDKLQVDWQEVAAIDGAINKGEFGSSEKSEVMKIGNKFYKFNSNNDVIGIKSFEDVLEGLDLSTRQKTKASSYLKQLRNNVLDERFVLEKNRSEFIKKISSYAIKNYKESGILPSITLAQAILESGWGDSDLSVKHNNLFGIKADPSWQGKKVKMNTSENYNDVIKDDFRSYNDIYQSIVDHAKFLTENKRYKESGVFNTQNYKQQAKALERAGYSTVKDKDGNLIYADLLISIIQNNNLMLFDTVAEREKN